MPVKTDKPELKTASGPKFFDVAKPGKSMANATARPVLISNRPIMQDPMVTADTSSVKASDINPSTIKVNIKPLADATVADAESAPTKETTEDKKSEETPPASDAKISAETSSEEPVEAAAVAGEPTIEVPAEKDISAEPAADKDDAPKEEVTEASEAKSTPQEADTEVSKESTPDVETTLEQTKDEQETAALEAAAKRREELDKLVQSREYFVPINSVESHRSKVAAMLGLVLIVVLGLLLVDLLLDVGFLRIGGVKSLTHFFSS